MNQLLSKVLRSGFAPAIAVSFLTASPVHAAGMAAYADISGCGENKVIGRATLVERPSSEGVKVVDLQLVISGLPDGKHAVHIHEKGVCSPCSEAKGHFDPGPAGNSSPDGNHPYHSGDLINIEIKDGIGAMATTTNRITLSPGPLSIFDADGSAFIVHVDPDTYCPQEEAKGCAGGARAACGVIKRM
jgi:Cu-Zn family superoxide dismutase